MVRADLIRAAGAVVFRRTEGGVRLLVLRASTSWDFPQGLVHPGEEDFDVARREVARGTGLADLDFPFGTAHRETLPYAGGRVACYYLAETDEAGVELPVAFEPGQVRHDEWRWVSFDEAEELLPPRLALVLDWARDAIAEL